MNDILLCLLNTVLLACGQLLFKYAARTDEITSVRDLINIMLQPAMIAAIALYAGTTLLWVYILTKIPLSYAHPIQALAFPLVVTLSFFLFKEPVPLNRWIGVGVIIVGAFIASK